MHPLNLSDLLSEVAVSPPEALAAPVSGIAYHSGAVVHGDAFFCISGFAFDGHDFARDAVARGASCVVATRPMPDLGVPVAIVSDSRVALAHASAAFFGHPSSRLDVIGITGTNGKTTATYLLDAVMRAAGRVTGVIGTVGTRIGDITEPAARTTPESRDLQALLDRMAGAGVETVSMEVSSQGIDLHRVDAMRFAAVAFTNLSQDHLDYHRTMEEYFAVKSRLMLTVGPERRVVDIDDAHGRRLVEQIGVHWTVGLAHDARVRAADVDLGPVSSTFDLVWAGETSRVVLPLAGAFNVSNALVAAACALASGVGLDIVAAGLSTAPQVPGRLERVDEGQDFTVLVDYAHTPDALEKAITAVRRVTPGRVITVFGCGGDRDPDKRPLMGRVAASLSDVAVVTSDNPRSEDPVGIILQVQDGMKDMDAEVRVEVDRGKAIALAISLARPGDAVLIAGKGHEDYQIFEDRTVHFDDREAAREEVRRRC